jgi:hypothetical protein
MLSVSKNWRKRGIGEHFMPIFIYKRVPYPVSASTLVKNSVNAMKQHGVEEARIIFVLCSTLIDPNLNYF